MENCVEVSTFYQPNMSNDNNHIPRPRQSFLPIKKSCLNHCYHPHQKSDSIIHGQKDMDTGDIDLLTLLFSVSPMQHSQIMEQVKGPEAGTYTPKHVYDINQRTEDLKILLLVSYWKVTMLYKQLLSWIGKSQIYQISNVSGNLKIIHHMFVCI